MKNWRARQCSGGSTPPVPTPFPVNVTTFTILHNDAFPDGTFAEIAFDHPLVTPFGTALACDIVLDTSGGPEQPNTGVVTADGPSTVNLTTIDQVDLLTVDGTCVVNSITGIDFGPGGVLIVPVAVNQDNGI